MNALENLEAKGWQVTAWRTTWECLEVGVLVLLDASGVVRDVLVGEATGDGMARRLTEYVETGEETPA